MLALLFEPLVQRNTSLYDLLLYAILAGATPMAAFPAIYFFWRKKK